MGSVAAAGIQLPRGTWDRPRPGIEPVPPALAGGFLTTGPPGKSEKLHLKKPAISCNLRSVTQHIQNTWDREAKSSQRFAAVGRLSLWFCLCKQTERFGVRLLPLRLGPFT